MSFFHGKRLKITPRAARIYLFFALVLLAAPTILYKVLPSHAGKVLVAAGAMTGEPFEKTVIYMQFHHGYGARGLILNKPLRGDQRADLQKQFPLGRLFYYGGPVGTQEDITLLVPDKGADKGFRLIDANFLRAHDLAAYNQIVADEVLMRDVRIFSGYSGWTVMQLNRELYRGAWDVVPFEGGYLEQAPQTEIWYKALEKVLDEKKADLDMI